MDLPKPKVERDRPSADKVRLLFRVPMVTGGWVTEFQGQAGGHQWPDDLPRPSYVSGQIEIGNLPPGDVQRAIEALRERVASIEAELERQRPEYEARQRESEERERRFQQELDAAKRTVDEMFD